MSHAYLMQIEQDTVGLIVREAGGYRFYATRRSLSPLQTTLFGTAREAEDAVLAVHGRRDAMRSSMTPLHSVATAD